MQKNRKRTFGNPEPPVWIIAGATASGKSALALEMARRFDAEIVSADSMQLYRSLDIGTAKPTPEEMRQVRHHLVDVFEIDEPVTVSRYRELALAAVAEIRARGKKVIVCGGSGLYLKTLLMGMDDLPADRELRERIEKEFPDIPAARRKLLQLDPAAGELPASLSLRRLQRLLEITMLTGSLPAPGKGFREQAFPAVMWYLRWEREELKRRIARRTDAMLAAGWIEETRRLLRMGLADAPTARQALGYPVIAEFLAGKLTAGQLRDTLVTRTWQFARRQMTWFAHQHPEALAIPMPLDTAAVTGWAELSGEGGSHA